MMANRSILLVLGVGIASGLGQSSAETARTTPVLGEHGFDGVSGDKQGTLAAVTALFPKHRVIRGKIEVPGVGGDESDSHNDILDVILIGAPGAADPDPRTALAWIEPDAAGHKVVSIHLQQPGVRTVHGVQPSDPSRRLVRDDVAVRCETVYVDETPTVRCSLGAKSRIVYHVTSDAKNMLPASQAAQRKWLAGDHVVEEIVWSE